MARSKFFVVKKPDFHKLMERLSREFGIFAPVRKDGEYNFRRIMRGDAIDLASLAKSYVNTEFPPKKFLLPEGEVIVEYGSKKMLAAPGQAGKPMGKSILFGVRPCDTHALDVLDRVMLGGHADQRYMQRRDSVLVFALNCAKAGKDCFCGSMGADKAEGFDLLFTDEGDAFHVEAGSGRGREIAKLPFFRKTPRKAKGRKLEFRKGIDTKGLNRIMADRFDSGIWKDVASRCLSCASCTAVCPTCCCFDMPHSRPAGGNAKVVRSWSYCMLKDFTMVAGGGVFREPRAERVKQFFYHKLVYGKRNQGKFHCVGCGRCIKECMAGIDITKEIARVRAEYEKREWKGRQRPLRAEDRQGRGR